MKPQTKFLSSKTHIEYFIKTPKTWFSGNKMKILLFLAALLTAQPTADKGLYRLRLGNNGSALSDWLRTKIWLSFSQLITEF